MRRRPDPRRGPSHWTHSAYKPKISVREQVDQGVSYWHLYVQRRLRQRLCQSCDRAVAVTLVLQAGRVVDWKPHLFCQTHLQARRKMTRLWRSHKL